MRVDQQQSFKTTETKAGRKEKKSKQMNKCIVTQGNLSFSSGSIEQSEGAEN